MHDQKASCLSSVQLQTPDRILPNSQMSKSLPFLILPHTDEFLPLKEGSWNQGICIKGSSHPSP